jgi:hypothetical protein
MRLGIIFGLSNDIRYIDWEKDLSLFPKLLQYNGKKWEWIMYQDGPNGIIELNFTQLPTYDPNFYVDDMPVFEEIAGYAKKECECGSTYSSFSWDHSRWCNLWRPWDVL